jgi:hypothetical protein
MSRTDAVEALYSDMAARHRARFRSIHVSRSQQDTVPVRLDDADNDYRSSALSSWRRTRTSSALTSSS